MRFLSMPYNFNPKVSNEIKNSVGFGAVFELNKQSLSIAAKLILNLRSTLGVRASSKNEKIRVSIDCLL